MANYCVLGYTVAGGVITDGKKLSVLEGTYRSGRDTPSEISPTLDGGRVMSLGVSQKTWSMDVRLQVTAATGYASLSDVEGWFADETQAGNLFKFQGLAGSTIYDVLLANKDKFVAEPLSFDQYAAGAWWKVHMEFVQL